VSFENSKEALKYLQNFWKPRLGSGVELDGERKKITKIEVEYEEQIFLEGESKVFFIQDLEWLPTNKEIEEVLADKFDLQFCSDCVRYNRQFWPRPRELKDYANIALNMRQLSNYSIV
jgi:hypothetical protein